jgi:hypothetical protein
MLTTARSVLDRFAIAGERLAFGPARVSAYAAAILLLEWPPLLKLIMPSLFMGMVPLRLAWVIADILFAPRREQQLRVVPTTPTRARFGRRRLILFFCYAAFGRMASDFLVALGVSAEVRNAVP